jgi:hypothetical protein
MSPNDQTAAGSDVAENTTNTSGTENENDTNNMKARVNWMNDGILPRELRDEIYGYLLPFDILVRYGALNIPELFDLLSINSRSKKEISELLKDKHHHIFEFTSIASMFNALDSASALILAPYKKLTIRVNGPYNGHSNLFGNNNGWHRTNICSTLHRDGDDV